MAKLVFSGRSKRDIIVIYHCWARFSPPATSGEVSHPLWTKSDVLTLPRRFRTETIILSPIITPEKKCILGHLKIEHVAVMMSTRKFYTAENTPLYTCRACQKFKKSKTAGLGCPRVATVAKIAHPGWLKGPNLTFEKKKALVFFLVT